MSTVQLIDALGYSQSPKFVSSTQAERLPPSELSFALGHLVQTCAELSDKSEDCDFDGVYVLQEKAGAPTVPVVYVFEAKTEAVARKIHQVVWNQNLVPFILVSSSSHVRVYPGFAFVKDRDNPLIVAAGSVADVLPQLPSFDAPSIDNGAIWQRWGHAADPTQRVDEKLLRDLKSLDKLLQHEGVTRETSHSLIGKFVYLYYLRHRRILSDRKLGKWGIDPSDLFSRNATITAFKAVDVQLQGWLNGAVFQLADNSLTSISRPQLRLAASVFCGDSPDGQLHFDFEAYDFSHIPIETLSCVYEQFLHDNVDEDGQSRGQRLGAYYTPIPLADYVIAELDQQRPLQEVMRVLDPSCGSGTFLVECYRRLIEKKIRLEGRRLKPSELRDLLTQSIFGIDRDEDACRIAELSLILTLLDYVKPPDLENTNFKLPSLRETNIFRDDFFDPNGRWQSVFQNEGFDWIVGNPPWSEVKGQPAEEHEHFHVWKWMTENKVAYPIGGNQIAEAFIWKAGEHLTDKGVSGLLIPASTWFKKESATFRRRFFAQRHVSLMANFANLAYVLFARRAESPASAIFFSTKPPSPDDTILTFAPFVVEQVANRPQKANRKVATWNIVVNGAEFQEVPVEAAAEGSALVWKLAMWGSKRDERLLESVRKRFSSFEQFCIDLGIFARQGIQFQQPTEGSMSRIEKKPELVGKAKLKVGRLSSLGRFFSFPQQMVPAVTEDEAYIRKRSGEVGLTVSKPPHIILDATRRFAVFSNEFIAVPHRQIGIAGSRNKELLLRVLSLYLSSDFSVYHQFFLSPEWGIGRSMAYLETLNLLPMPLLESELVDWQELQRELFALSAKRFGPTGWQLDDEDKFCALLGELNDRVFKALRLRPNERCMVEDFVNLNMGLNKGKVTAEAKRRPTHDEIEIYFHTLRDCLDGFLLAERGARHRIEAIRDDESAFFSISLEKTSQSIPTQVLGADHAGTKVLMNLRDRLRRKHSQWVYFDRKLNVYQQGILYQFKPMQRLHWTRRQAILDADDIIAESVSRGTD